MVLGEHRTLNRCPCALCGDSLNQSRSRMIVHRSLPAVLSRVKLVLIAFCVLSQLRQETAVAFKIGFGSDTWSFSCAGKYQCNAATGFYASATQTKVVAGGWQCDDASLASMSLDIQMFLNNVCAPTWILTTSTPVYSYEQYSQNMAVVNQGCVQVNTEDFYSFEAEYGCTAAKPTLAPTSNALLTSSTDLLNNQTVEFSNSISPTLSSVSPQHEVSIVVAEFSNSISPTLSSLSPPHEASIVPIVASVISVTVACLILAAVLGACACRRILCFAALRARNENKAMPVTDAVRTTTVDQSESNYAEIPDYNVGQSISVPREQFEGFVQSLNNERLNTLNSHSCFHSPSNEDDPSLAVYANAQFTEQRQGDFRRPTNDRNEVVMVECDLYSSS